MTYAPLSQRLSGASNFRDLGRYPARGGRAMRPGRIYRSDHLAHLTPEDQARLQALGVTRTVDFRGVGERAALAYELPGVQQHALSIEPTVVQRAKALQDRGEQLTPEHAAELMEQTYRDFVLHNSPRFTELFRLLLDNDQPLVFHCTAGKDRTGFAAALILHALGVEQPIVLHDYLLTNELYQRPTGLIGQGPEEVMRVIWRVQPSFLEAALDTVQQHHGGLTPYLQDVLGVGPAEVRQLESLYLL